MANQYLRHLDNVLIRCKQVQANSGLPRSTLYSRIAQGLFTKPVALGARAVGWPLYEVVELNAARIAGKSDDQIRKLVAKLESSRSAALVC